MERCNSLVRQFIVVILAVCINVTLAAGATGSAGAAGFSQAGNSSTTSPEQLDKLLAPVALYP
ncbi:MAG: hypothetical protein WBV87_06185, partial [Candidatus Acidiferrales bacterium]